MRQTHTALRHRSARGLTLIELMVALALGLVVIGVVAANYLSARQAQRTAVALSRMTEDATAAFSVMRRYVAMAGYSTVTSAAGTGLGRAYTGRAIFGCNHGFANATARHIDNLSCSGPAPGHAARPDALVVVYQATLANALPGRRAGGAPEPTDLLGQVLHPTSAPPYLAQARFTIVNNGLHVAGNGGTITPPPAALPSSQELMPNVLDMQIWYGLSGVDASGRPDQAVNRYVDADAIGDIAQADWRTVAAVRVCLLMVSEEQVLDAPTPYYPCSAATSDAADPELVTPGDRRLYRAYTTTIHIPNRLGG